MAITDMTIKHRLAMAVLQFQDKHLRKDVTTGSLIQVELNGYIWQVEEKTLLPGLFPFFLPLLLVPSFVDACIFIEPLAFAEPAIRVVLGSPYAF